MGLSMEFYAGPPVEIGKAFTAVELDGLRDGSLAHSYADLSLHLSPDHLDILSEEIAACVGSAPIHLLDSLESHVGGTEGQSSADVVATTWVEAVAAAPDSSIGMVAEKWMAAVSEETGEPIVERGDVMLAVESLVRLCRDAMMRNTRVIFAWYL